jgi:putative membrane-bound dehydrogenase-like protein
MRFLLWSLFSLVLVAFAFIESADEASAQIRNDLDALKTMKVPDGFEIRLFAGADMVNNPTAIDVDIYGRVWVAEGKNYRSTFNKGPGPLDPDADRIKVLEDTKGTGRADKVTVFTDKIPIVPMSICIAGDHAFVGVAPQFWRFDGAADRNNPFGKNKTVLLDGFHRSGRKGPAWVDHDHALHGLMIGPDARMYFTVGDEGMNLTDKSGVKHAPNGASMVRMNLDGTQMKVLADNFRNPYELWVDSFGRVFCSDNDDDGNAQVRICHIIEGGDYGYRHNPKLPQSPTKHHWHEDVPGVTHKLLRTFAGSPCGILVYEGNLLPERFRGSLIHADCGAPQCVRAYHMKPNGAGYTLEIENLLTSTDKWFRPTDIAHAPDGSLYISDWYDSGVGGHSFRKRDIGRIYHLTMKDAPPPAKTASPDLTTVPGLLSSLMSPMPSIRYLAITKLRERKGESLQPLTKMAKEGKHPLERARALWVLFGMGEDGRKVILETLKDTDYRFRAQAVRMLREDMDKNLEAITALANDDNAEVRLEVTVALREVPTDKAANALKQLVKKADPADVWYMPTIGGAIKKRDPQFIQTLFASAGSPTEEASLVGLAWQLQRPETIPYLVGVLKSPKAPEHYARALDSLGWIADPAAGEAVATIAAGEADVGRVRLALELLKRKMGNDWKPVAAKPVFEQLFTRCLKEPTLVPPFLSLIGTAQATAFVPKVLEMIDKSTNDPALQRAAVEALGQIKSPQTMAKLNDLLKAARRVDVKPQTPPAPTPEIAFAALGALYAMNTPDTTKSVEALVLDAAYPTDLRREAVKLFGRTPAGCRFLLEAAEKSKLPVDVKGDATEVTNRSPDKKVQEMAAKVLPLPKLAGNRPLPPLKEILSKKGDAAKGQAVFFKEQSQCSKCHRVGGVGSWVGPDLSQIGAKAPKENLLDSILNPSAAIAHEYVQYSIETQKGALYAGIIVEETPEALILKNANGDRLTVSLKEIAQKTAMPVSIMPEGLVQNMSDQELVDLLAYLGTLRQPAIPVATWNLLGPFDTANVPSGLDGKIDLAASFPGKGGTKVSWRKLNSDREGRIDLEAAVGTRQAAVFLHADLQSKAAQEGKIVLLLPPDAKVAGWLDGKELKFEPVATTITTKEGVPHGAALAFPAGKGSLLLKVVGGSTAQLTAISTVVSPNGVELAGGK